MSEHLTEVDEHTIAECKRTLDGLVLKMHPRVVFIDFSHQPIPLVAIIGPFGKIGWHSTMDCLPERFRFLNAEREEDRILLVQSENYSVDLLSNVVADMLVNVGKKQD